jgi:Gpi18-like mannosyltransferase
MKLFKIPAYFYGTIFVLGLLVSVWLYFIAPMKGTYHTNYNDYMIYKQSFLNLFRHIDLYSYHEKDYNDLYKYSPSFAFFMAPFAVLPNFVGLILWNTLNLFVLFYAIRNFPFPSEKKTLLVIGFILVAAVTSVIFTQCNCIIAGLLILTFEFLEKKKILWATFFVTLCVFIKPYGLAGFILFLFYPGKWKSAAYTAMWTVIIILLPLLIVSPSDLVGVYKSWFNLLKTDYDESFGMSLLGLLHSWFGITAKYLILAAGTVILVLPLIRIKSFADQAFKTLFLASILIWVIIFNHKGETPAFIIAICGIAIWYFTQPYSNVNFMLLLSAILFTVLEPTDIFPQIFRRNILTPYVICVVPCTLVWMKITWDLMTKDFSPAKIKPVESVIN